MRRRYQPDANTGKWSGGPDGGTMGRAWGRGGEGMRPFSAGAGRRHVAIEQTVPIFCFLLTLAGTYRRPSEHALAFLLFAHSLPSPAGLARDQSHPHGNEKQGLLCPLLLPRP
jgi:hypothetical protein